MLRLFDWPWFALLFTISLSAYAQTTVVENAFIIDPATASINRASILVQEGVIQAIGRKVKIPKGANRINASGKYVLPGLWDMHAHLAAFGPTGLASEKYVAHGVLHVRDMGGHLKNLLDLRDSIQAGQHVGPYVVLAGPTLNSEQPADFHRLVTNDTEARKAVRELKTAGVDFIKIHRATNREAFLAIADETRKQSLTFSGHVPLALSWIEASQSGMRTIEHIQTIFENLQPDARKIPAEFESLTQRLLGTLGDTIFSVLRANQTYFDPTLIGYKESISNAKPEVAALRRVAYDKMKAIVTKAHQAGVPIITGTDVLYDHGNLLIKELLLLESIGMSRQAVLKAATLTSAEAALHPELGKLRPGAPAAFLIVQKNPLEDLHHLRELYAVILYNRVLTQDELQRIRLLKP